jgi:hypothetical protein
VLSSFFVVTQVLEQEKQTGLKGREGGGREKGEERMEERMGERRGGEKGRREGGGGEGEKGRSGGGKWGGVGEEVSNLPGTLTQKYASMISNPDEKVDVVGKTPKAEPLISCEIITKFTK